MKTRLIFDADMLLYISLTNAEKEIEWYEDFYTRHCDLKEAKTVFDEHVMQIAQQVCTHWNIEGEYEIIMCLTSKDGNFRQDILSEYKANRSQKNKPMCYLPMREYVQEYYNTVMYPMLEADDCVGLLADRDTDIIISGDKDFKCIPARFYDFIRNEYHETTVEEANYFHLLQTLTGDTADNYKGCPKVGEVRAKRLLDESPTWETVKKAYEDNHSTEEEALKNARVAFILRKGYYNEKTGEIRLWTPHKEASDCETMQTLM